MTRYPLPAGQRNANLNTAVFDRRDRLWFTGQSGVYGRQLAGRPGEVWGTASAADTRLDMVL